MIATLVHLNGFDVDPTAGLVYGPKGKPVGSKDTSGYFPIDGRTRRYGLLSAHRLVWQAANGPIPDHLVINHKNGVKTDNRIANLELVTQQDNILQAYRTGLKSNKGDKHPTGSSAALMAVRSVDCMPKALPVARCRTSSASRSRRSTTFAAVRPGPT